MDHVPHGHWKTTTFLAALRHDGLTAPMVVPSTDCVPDVCLPGSPAAESSAHERGGHTNSIESVWAVLKRGFYGIFHWFSRKHTQLYLDEFSFRLNEGNCRIAGAVVTFTPSEVIKLDGVHPTPYRTHGGVISGSFQPQPFVSNASAGSKKLVEPLLKTVNQVIDSLSSS